MFPGRYFAKAYFPGRYFEPVEGVVPPVKPPPARRGGRYRPQPIQPEWPVDVDDEELMFWIL